VYLAMLSGAFQDDALHDSVQDIRERLAARDKGIRRFHWDLEFPEVFNDEHGGFDVFVGNPPFLGGIKISGFLGDCYLLWLKFLCESADGNSDLCAYFFRRVYALLRRGGSAGLIATNTICQGDTRRSSLSHICGSGGLIYPAEKRMKWAGVAAVIVSSVHFHRVDGSHSIQCYLDQSRYQVLRLFCCQVLAAKTHDPSWPVKGFAFPAQQ